MEASAVSETPVKRGRGRPRGSRNRPKEAPAPMSQEDLMELESQLAARYVQTMAVRAAAVERAKGVKALIRSKLGREGLETIENSVIAAGEAQTDIETAGQVVLVAGD